MFAYCNNNPVNAKDPNGHALLQVWEHDDPILDLFFGAGGNGAGGGSGFGGGLAVATVGIGALGTIGCVLSSTSDDIDWEKGDKNHILKGTDGKHIDGWRRFGIDPENNDNKNNWIALLPLLQEVVDDADYSYDEVLKSGGMAIYYVKTYITEGVHVVVKIWESIDGLIEQISDAIPYIFR
jgi:hypothetical protein